MKCGTRNSRWYSGAGIYRNVWLLHGLEDGTYTGYRMAPATGFKTPMGIQAENGSLQVEVPGKGTDAVLALHR